MVFLETPWRPMLRKPILSARRIFGTCSLAERVRSAELGAALSQVGCCHIKLLMQRKQNYEGNN